MQKKKEKEKKGIWRNVNISTAGRTLATTQEPLIIIEQYVCNTTNAVVL